MPQPYSMHTQPIGQWLAVGVILAAAAAIFLGATPCDINVAPITYRYAENLAVGHGFVYNIGERISAPAPRCTRCSLRASAFLGFPHNWPAMPSISWHRSPSWLSPSHLARRLTGSLWGGLLAGVILLGQGSFLRYSMAGMETPLYTDHPVGTSGLDPRADEACGRIHRIRGADAAGWTGSDRRCPFSQPGCKSDVSLVGVAAPCGDLRSPGSSLRCFILARRCRCLCRPSRLVSWQRTATGF